MSEANSFQVPASDIDGNCSMRLSIEPSAFGIANVFEKANTLIERVAKPVPLARPVTNLRCARAGPGLVGV